MMSQPRSVLAALQQSSVFRRAGRGGHGRRGDGQRGGEGRGREGQQLSRLRGQEGAGAQVHRLQGAAAAQQREALLRHLHATWNTHTGWTGLAGRGEASLARRRAAMAALTCQVQVDQGLSEGGDGGGEGVDRLVRDAPTLTQVQPGQVRDEAHQQARRHVRQIQTGQSQLRHVLETPSSALAVS